MGLFAEFMKKIPPSRLTHVISEKNVMWDEFREKWQKIKFKNPGVLIYHDPGISHLYMPCRL